MKIINVTADILSQQNNAQRSFIRKNNEEKTDENKQNGEKKKQSRKAKGTQAESL